MSSQSPSSDRVRLRRLAVRGRYDETTIRSVLDEAMVAHVGVETDDGPVVLPMLHAHDDDYLYLHGAAANDLLERGSGADVCVTVTIVDGLVIARSAFHHSMNYRSVVVRGRAETVDDPDEKRRALDLLTDRVGVGRSADCRPPKRVELLATRVLRLPLTEASAKVRTGDASDDSEDMTLGHWAGVVPVATVFGEPEPNADLAAGTAIPDYLRR
jgi:nitroimidazol reductase NimA-like FMN-containing flavoprotein (pyridoxamine 5'-phosphate oxidase superfamily)